MTRLRSRVGKALRKLRGHNGTGLSLAEALAQAYATGWSDARCVFVLSTGRAGTETLTGLFSLCADAVAEHEPEPCLVKASFDAYMDGCSGKKWRDLVLAARDGFIVDANRQRKVYVETNNRLTYLAPALATAFPAARFIHVHRHPYEVVRSFMQREAYQGHPWDFARIRPRPGEPDETRWESLSTLEKVAWYWARVNGDAHDFLATLPESRRLTIGADALFKGDAPTLSALFMFAGVTCPTRRRVQHVLGSKLNAQTSRTSWKWTEADRERVRPLIHASAVSLGYEL